MFLAFILGAFMLITPPVPSPMTINAPSKYMFPALMLPIFKTPDVVLVRKLVVFDVALFRILHGPVVVPLNKLTVAPELLELKELHAKVFKTVVVPVEELRVKLVAAPNAVTVVGNAINVDVAAFVLIVGAFKLSADADNVVVLDACPTFKAVDEPPNALTVNGLAISVKFVQALDTFTAPVAAKLK